MHRLPQILRVSDTAPPLQTVWQVILRFTCAHTRVRGPCGPWPPIVTLHAGLATNFRCRCHMLCPRTHHAIALHVLHMLCVL